MRYLISSLICTLLWLLPLFSTSQNNPTDFVNPFIGTGGHGHTFPGATVPFGMVQLSPDTRLEGWDGCGGYHYSDEYIYGFSHTHLSGTGVPDYGDILLMPFTGENLWNNGYDGKPGYRSKFSHNEESASPGFYQVRLADDDIHVKLTASARVGFHSYSYPKNQTRKVILDLEHRDVVTNSWVRQVSPFEIEGYRGSTAWANDQRVYFVIRFSDSIHSVTYNNEDSKNAIMAERKEGKRIKVIYEFGRQNDNNLQAKVALSAVSTENARENLNNEIGNLDFEKVKNNARQLWNNELKKIVVSEENEKNLIVFYTALYHCMVSPNLYLDVNSSYLGRDLKEHKSDHDYYTVFSLWDTYRALHPLMTIIDQKRTNDFINTFLKQYSDGGLLPVWELSANETYCMIGYHSIPVILDAYAKGIRNYDTDLALEAMLKSAENDLFGLKYYREFGFVPAEKEHESVSKTLEYAYDDWCIAKMAELMDKKEIAQQYYIRSQSYKNLFDPSTGFMRARMYGAWYEPFEPREVNFNYTEANSWQYSFYVPHDMNYFMNMHGGKNGLNEKLDALFNAPVETTGREQSDITGLIGQYAHGNEPSHHIAYLYNYADQPWKAQEKVKYIMDNFYSVEPDGLIGNEDCGQMSAWAVLSSLGFYPICPGNNQYAIGVPRFKEATISLENGHKFTIKAENVNDENAYIISAKLNGMTYDKAYLMHDDIMKGGLLEFEMGPNPNKSWGLNFDAASSHISNDRLIAIAPLIRNSIFTFNDSTKVELYSIDDSEIRYTLNDSEPGEGSLLYTDPLIIKENTTIKYKAYKKGFLPSQTQVSQFTIVPDDITLTLVSRPASQYSGNGENNLVDGMKGSEDFRLGGWQGFQGIDLEAIIEIKDSRAVKSVSIGFLQDINAWIFMPKKIELWSSYDGKSFRLISESINEIPTNQWGTIINYYDLPITGISGRFLKVVARNIGVCPESHKGEGNPAWIFADEIIVTY